MQSEDIASISIDIDSRDTRRGYGVERVIDATMSDLRRRGFGILLFHDSKLVTVRALPRILDHLAKEGFRVVHLKTKSLYRAEPDLVARYRRRLDGTLVRATEPSELKGRRPVTDVARHHMPPQRNQQPVPKITPKADDWRSSAFDSD